MLFFEPREEGLSVGSSYSRAILGVSWALTGVATISFFARLYIRLHRFARLRWDDFFVAIAWCFSIPLAAQVTVSALHSRKEQQGTGSIFTNRLLTQAFFYTSLWSIKISFLIFFRTIGGTALHHLKYYWRFVLGFTILTYFALWATNPYKCFIEKGMVACAEDPRVRRLMPITFSVVCGVDILTDCLIMAIPFAILYRVRLSIRQRLVLYTLFSLVAITMAVAIVRAVFGTKAMKHTLNVTWLLFFAHLEASTAIFIACIGSFRALFTRDDRVHSPTFRPSRISAPMRGAFLESESTEELQSTDLQYMTPKLAST